jgi:integrase
VADAAGELELAIPKIRRGRYFPSFPEPRKRSEQALVSVVQEAYVAGVSTRKVDQVVESLGLRISKSEVSRICQGLDEQVERQRRPLRVLRLARVGPTGEKRTFHSLRHTYAKTVLERGSSIFWLSRQLGHSSVMVTDSVYGHWERKAAKREAAKMKGAFPV